MIKTYRIRLLPNETQEQLFFKHANCSRFIWNWGLAYQESLYRNGEKHLSGYDIRKEEIKLKKQEDYIWLNEISSHTLDQTIMDLDDTYRRYFKRLIHKPKFKKKNKAECKFPVRAVNLYFKNNCVNIEKIGKIKYQNDFMFEQGRNKYKILNSRIKLKNGKWILTFGMEFEKQKQKLKDYSMGIDLGIKDLAIVSYGDKNIVFENINKTKKVKMLKNKLKHLQRNTNRKYVYNNKNKIYETNWYKTKNILKTEKKIKKIYNHLSNIRRNYIHQCTHKLIMLLPQKITMESLNISGMMKNRHLSGALQEQCLFEFIRQMKYKSEWNGIEFIQVDRWYPSSKTCSNCGEINHNLKLSDRVYRCEYCGFEIDRDINASINLMNYSNV